MGLEYRQFAPSAPIADYVLCFWTLQGDDTAFATAERILPDGHAELVWNFADPFLRHAPGAPPRRQAAALVVGQITGPLLIQPTGRIDLLGVRFRTPALGALLGGVPAHELSDRDFAVEDVLGRRLRSVPEQAVLAPTPEDRVAIVDALLCAELSHAPPVDSRIAAAVHAIATTHGTARIDRVAGAVGFSTRQLERRFRADVGIGPKRFARVTRFKRLVALLGAARPTAWARLAVRCGYYDQAHLIRDFREFAGGPPGTLALHGDQPLTEAFIRES